MTVTVIVNDYTLSRKSLIYLTDEHFEKFNQVWEKTDTILSDMQDTSLFSGRTRWCDLDPTHFRLMISRNLTILAEQSSEGSEKLVVMRSLQFLMSGLILCLQKRSESIIELLKINRFGEKEVTFDYCASLNIAIENYHKKPIFRVVVDNEEH